ncbi:MAG: hypothetical protein L0Y71_05585 [Gemmataceae bacterium]|nr:hypothetical protein [Gemmataceae bacterium]
MDSRLFDDLQQTLSTDGPVAAIDKLCADLKARKEYAGLFYTLLMKKRHELGVSPIATGSNQDLPPALHQAFEDGIREAARTVGKLWLDEGDIPQAWAYYRMLGETEPVAQALDKVELKEDQDVQPIIDIAFHQGVHPRKGFEWILRRYGICSSITTMAGGDLPFPLEVRQDCIKRLIRALHEELFERLKAEIQRKQGFAPTGKTIAELMAGRDWLFADEFYHIDLSHLSAVVQMSAQLDNCDELGMARELCQYGQRLSPRFQQVTDPPFENQYQDYEVFLSILQGDDVEKGLAHFRAKAENADPETVGTYPAEVLVNLLLRLGRKDEALETSRRFLARLGEARTSCPSFVELCQQTRNFQALADVAREQENPVNYLAGLIAARTA